jgi:uncharacterized RDD family membrane protein YckC
MICRNCNQEVTPDSFFCQWCSAFLAAPGRGRKANLFRRWLALALDPFIALFMYLVALLVAAVIGGAAGGEEGAAGFGGLLTILFPLGYFVWFLTLLPKGLTPGKKLLGLQVLNQQTGAIPGFGTMFLREIVGRFLSGLFLGLGYFWALWDKNAQAWHDKLAGTVVVKTT